MYRLVQKKKTPIFLNFTLRLVVSHKQVAEAKELPVAELRNTGIPEFRNSGENYSNGKTVKPSSRFFRSWDTPIFRNYGVEVLCHWQLFSSAQRKAKF
jgi:hypothetical protein